MDTSKPPVYLCPTCGHAGDTLACVSSLCRECKKKVFYFYICFKDLIVPYFEYLECAYK